MKNRIVASVVAVIFCLIPASCGDSGTASDGKVNPPDSASKLEGKTYRDVVTRFKQAGFTNIETKAQEDLIAGWIAKEDEVDKVAIDGKTDFGASDDFDPAAKVVIAYHAFPRNNKNDENGKKKTDRQQREASQKEAEAAKKKAEEEAARRQAEEQEAARKAAEEEAARKAAEEEAARRQAEEQESARKAAEEEAARQAAEQQTQQQQNVYYPNCTAVKAAGAAPLYQGQPGYNHKLDRDGDGVACEK